MIKKWDDILISILLKCTCKILQKVDIFFTWPTISPVFLTCELTPYLLKLPTECAINYARAHELSRAYA
jgi:hypothetical protein